MMRETHQQQPLSQAERRQVKEDRSIQREGVRLVRAEKQADVNSQRKLEEVYRTGGPRQFEERPPSDAWKCNECGFLNYDERMLCNRCVAAAPHARLGSSNSSKRGPQGGTQTLPGSGTSTATNVRQPVIEADPSGDTLIVNTVGGRCYRVYDTAALQEQIRVRYARHRSSKGSSRRVLQQGDDDIGDTADDEVGTVTQQDNNSVPPQPYGQYEGDAIPLEQRRYVPAAAAATHHDTTEQQLTTAIHGAVNRLLQDDDDEHDDEPGCRFRLEGNDNDDNATLTSHQRKNDLRPTATYNSASGQYYVQIAASWSSNTQELARLVRPVSQSTGARIEIRMDRTTGGKSSPPPGAIALIRSQHEDVARDAAARVTSIFAAASATSPADAGDVSGVAAKVTTTPPATAAPQAAAVGYTHFLSLPLGTIPTLEPLVKALQDDIRCVVGLRTGPLSLPTLTAAATTSDPAKVVPMALPLETAGGTTSSDDPPHFGVDDSILQSLPKFHFTLLMLSLPTTHAIAQAVALMPKVKEIMSDCFPTTTTASPSTSGTGKGHKTSPMLHIKGLATMTPNIKRSNVLYMELVEDETGGRSAFYRQLKRIHRLFLDAGLTTEREVQLAEKIHATVINTKWRRAGGRAGGGGRGGGRGGGGSQWQRQVTFDASRILEVLGNVSLGLHRPATIELSRLGGGLSPNGYFGAEAVAAYDP